MLWLTRRVDEKIVLIVKGVTIELLFRKQKGNQIGLGIKAPDEVQIWRDEMLKEAQNENYSNRPADLNEPGEKHSGVSR